MLSFVAFVCRGFVFLIFIIVYRIGYNKMDTIILYEDDALIVVHKPQNLATQTARVGQIDVVSELKNYRRNQGEEPYIGVVHRLDQPVEGLLVFAKTPQVAAMLTSQLQSGKLQKGYVAFVDGIVNAGDCARLTDYLVKDVRTNFSRVVDSDTRGAKKAGLMYKGLQVCMIEALSEKFSIVEIELFTGRHHQIRVQFSHAGMPLLGDNKYATEHTRKLSEQLGIKSTALLAHRLHFCHPLEGRELKFSIEYTQAEFCRGSLAVTVLT